MILLNTFDWRLPTYKPCGIYLAYKDKTILIVGHSHSNIHFYWYENGYYDTPENKPYSYVYIKESTFDYEARNIPRVMR